MAEPMTDAELRMVQVRHAGCERRSADGMAPTWVLWYSQDVGALLAEIDRLKAALEEAEDKADLWRNRASERSERG